jgi:F-type H+-transporting ATPase subunit epsilon
MAAKTLSVEIVSAARTLWSGEAEFVTAPTPEGSIGIYPMHQPLLSVLGQGEVRVDTPGAGKVRANVSGGFISVDSDMVTVVTDTGEIAGQ